MEMMLAPIPPHPAACMVPHKTRTDLGPGLLIQCGPNVKLYCDILPKSHEILMFVCLQKETKQCRDARKVDRTLPGEQHI